MPTNVLPCREHNAIEAIIFTIVLQQGPNQDVINRVMTALEPFHAELPGSQQANQGQGIFISFGMAPAMFGEVVRFHARPDGQHDWRVQLAGNMLQVTCHDYTNFTAVWTQAARYLNAMISAIDGGTIVQEVSHQVIDRLNYGRIESVDRFDMASVFQDSSPFLTQKSWSSGLEWHVYQGWFENNGEARRILNQLNISSMSTAPEQYGCVIDHRSVLQARLDTPITCGELLQASQQEATGLSSIMRHLHDQNMGIIQDLLTPAVQARIGMGE